MLVAFLSRYSNINLEELMGYSKRKFLWKLVSTLPYFIRKNLILSSVEAKQSDLVGFIFKRAETQDELAQSFTLLYESYLQNGLMDENEIKMRITKYHALPTTVILVAKLNDEVVGTVTHILDSSFGLPTEDICSLEDLRKNGHRIAEISALAIKKEYRHHKSLLFGLTRFLYTYATQFCGVKYWVISIRTKVQDFYTAIFGFQLLVKNASCNFVNDGKTSSLMCDLENNQKLFKDLYNHKSPEKNLYAFYCDFQLNVIGQFPEKNSLEMTQLFHKENILNHFYNKKTKLFLDMKRAETQELISRDLFGSYRNTMRVGDQLEASNQRKSARVVTYLQAILAFGGGNANIVPIKILELSKNGFLIQTDQKLQINKKLKIQFSLGGGRLFKTLATVLQNRANNKFILTVADNTEWALFYEGLASTKSTSAATSA